MNGLLPLTAALLYLSSAFVLGWRAQRLAHGAAAARTPPLLLALGAVLIHGVALWQGILTGGSVDLGLFHALSLSSLIVVVLLLATTTRLPVENLGILLLPLAALVLLFEWSIPATRTLGADTPWQVDLHVVLSLLAWSLLALAAVQALLLAWQERRLRARHAGGLLRALPPLATMETLLFQMIGTGFVLLSAALLAGLLFIDDLFAQHLVHKTVLSLVAWGVFATLLYGRRRHGWRGRMAVRWTLAGFLILALAWLGSKLVLELILQRGP